MANAVHLDNIRLQVSVIRRQCDELLRAVESEVNAKGNGTCAPLTGYTMSFTTATTAATAIATAKTAIDTAITGLGT